jgi:hypothetical protein
MYDEVCCCERVVVGQVLNERDNIRLSSVSRSIDVQFTRLSRHVSLTHTPVDSRQARHAVNKNIPPK